MNFDQNFWEKITDILMPFPASRTKELYDRRLRLAHYTTAENAIKIIKSKNIWMKNARGMVDFSEIRYGFDQLRDYFNDTTNRTRFYRALDRCSENVGKDAVALFDKLWDQISTNTYISCFSEHNPEEDEHGRLSMWRAFGGNTAAVALILNPPARYSATKLNVFLSPVAYFHRTGLRLK